MKFKPETFFNITSVILPAWWAYAIQDDIFSRDSIWQIAAHVFMFLFTTASALTNMESIVADLFEKAKFDQIPSSKILRPIMYASAYFIACMTGIVNLFVSKQDKQTTFKESLNELLMVAEWKIKIVEECRDGSIYAWRILKGLCKYCEADCYDYVHDQIGAVQLAHNVYVKCPIASTKR